MPATISKTNKTSPDCPICSRENIWIDGILFEDQDLIVAHSANIQVPGYTVIFPTRHVTSFAELTDNEMLKTCNITKICTKLLHELKAEKVYLCSFSEMVSHWHLHIFPRYAEMKNIEACLTYGNFDGAKLFSYAQQNFRATKKEEMQTPKILAAIDHLKTALNNL
jgi:diadenosine tetraphosphate (Ap4A) HIT family hydrolase